MRAVAGALEDGVVAHNSGDYATALRLWRPLAEQGDAMAQSNLGDMYRAGQGVPQDHAEAVKWFHLAAKQGFAGAQYNLGLMYGNGQGVPQDYVRAYMWFNLATSRLPPGEDHDMAVNNRNAAADLMTPAQIAEAQKLARQWKPRDDRAD